MAIIMVIPGYTQIDKITIITLIIISNTTAIELMITYVLSNRELRLIVPTNKITHNIECNIAPKRNGEAMMLRSISKFFRLSV